MDRVEYDAITISTLGAIRTGATLLITHPLRTIALLQQTTYPHDYFPTVMKKVLQQEGINGLYLGLIPQISRQTINACWIWPFIVHAPDRFQDLGYSPLLAQALTGIPTGILSAAFTSPLDRLRILQTIFKNKKLQWSDITQGWRGFPLLSLKLSSLWTSYLVSQDYLRTEKMRQLNTPNLPFPALSLISLQTAIIASTISAPFDYYNTHFHTNPLTYRAFLQTIRPFKWQVFRGLPLTSTNLLIQNLSSLYLLDLFSPPVFSR